MQRTDADVLIGGEGDDALFSKPGGDLLDGGPGADQLAADDPCGHIFDGGPGGSDVIGFDPLEPIREGGKAPEAGSDREDRRPRRLPRAELLRPGPHHPRRRDPRGKPASTTS